jgi:hypothetical protein
MLGYTLKHVLELIPEALPMVKAASIEAEYPVSNKDNCLASALAINYKKSFTSDTVDYDVLTKVAQAVTLYDLENTVQELTGKMVSRSQSKWVKEASVTEEGSYLTKQAAWEGDLSGLGFNVKEMAERAEVLMEKAAAEGATVSSHVEMYSGNGVFLKEALLASLSVRYGLTNDPTFVKLASSVGVESDLISGTRTVKSICSVINRLDEQHALSNQGFNIYKEAMISKQAGFIKCMVKVAGKDYPLERIMGIPDSYLDGYLGSGFSKELHSDPNYAKSMVESLPADSQQILATILRS